jgi:hypothetical protein
VQRGQSVGLAVGVGERAAALLGELGYAHAAAISPGGQAVPPCPARGVLLPRNQSPLGRLKPPSVRRPTMDHRGAENPMRPQDHPARGSWGTGKGE